MIECKPKIQGKSNRISHILQNQCDWKILFQSHMLHTWYIGKTWWFLYSIHLGTNRKCTMEFWFVPRCFQCFQCSKMEFHSPLQLHLGSMESHGIPVEVAVSGVTSSWWQGPAPSKACADSSVDGRREGWVGGWEISDLDGIHISTGFRWTLFGI